MRGSVLLRAMGVFYATTFLLHDRLGMALVMLGLSNLGALAYEHWCEFLYRRAKRRAKP